MIKNILEEAGRYEDVVNILNDIMSNDTNTSYPVHAFIDDDGETKWRIDGKSVSEEASNLLNLINTQTDTKNDADSFPNLLQYVRTHSDQLLHNYSVSISHRKEPKIDMEVIRCWEILENLLYYFSDDEWDDWSIPEGWKRI